MDTNNYVRLPLKNAYNVRDLGGYPCGGGMATKWRSFLRADGLSELDSGDMEFLLDYGLTAVIDLRSENETLAQVNPFSKKDGVSYINIPLISDKIADVTRLRDEEIRLRDPDKMLGEFYLELLMHSKPAIKEIFEFIAGQDKGCIMFHCSAGKDRTGIVAMLLLGLAGASREDLTTNYEVSYIYTRQNPVFQLIADKHHPALLQSKPENIEACIDHVVDNYGSFYDYLLSAGLSPETLDGVRDKLLG